MFYFKTFQKINPIFLLHLFIASVLLLSLFLNSNIATAAGIYPYCRGPLQGVFIGPNDQFSCPLSGVTTNDINYPYICTDNSDIGGDIYCDPYQGNLGLQSYRNCSSATNNGSEWQIIGCSLVNTNAVVTSVRATPISSSQIDVSWTTTGIIGQQDIRRQIYIDNRWTSQEIIPLDPNLRNYSDLGLTGNTDYRYIVSVYNGILSFNRADAFATTPADSTPPSNIINLSVSSCSSASCSLSWTAPGNNGNVGTASSYDMRYSTSPITNSNWDSAVQATGEPAPTAAGATQSMNISGLSPTTTYYFAIKSSDGSNVSTLSNAPTGTTTAVPDTTAPTSSNPNLQAARDTTNTSSQINISWNAYTDNVGVAGYRIERCQGAGCLNFVQIDTSVAASYSDSGLSPSTSYSYRIRAYDAAIPANISNYSNIASATTAAPPDTIAPVFTKTAPADLLASGTLSTNLSGSTNEIAICRWADSSGQPFVSMNPMNPVSGGMNHTAMITNLVDGQSYYVKCRDTAPTPNISGDFLVFSIDSPVPDTSPPQISDRQPFGILSFFSDGSGTVTISVVTNKPAYCRYSQNTDADFNLMTALNTAPSADAKYQRYHFTDQTVFNGANYEYYVRCQDTTTGITNTSGSPPISFSVATPPNTLPTVNLTASPTSGDAPLQVIASGVASDPDGDPLTYSLDWGDGLSEVYAPDSSVSHTYNNADSYTVTLTVVDSRGGRASDMEYITVNALQESILPPITGGICAVECNDNSECDAGEVCGPSHICIPEVAADAGPVRSGGYASLSDGAQNQPADRDNGNVAVFNAGATSVIIGLQTKTGAQSECRYYISEEPGSNNPITGVAFSNTQFMRPLSTQDFINHSQTLTGLRNGNYTLNVRCQNTSTLAVNTIDYPISFNIGGPGLLACVPGERCPSGLECPSSGPFTGRCEPAPYTCLINQYFIKNNIPYLLDICFPGFTSAFSSIYVPPSSCGASGQQCCASGARCSGSLTCQSNNTCGGGSACTPGNQGCSCINGTSCTGTLTCSSNVCILPPSCTPNPALCTAPTPACDRTTTGTDNCGTCTKRGSACVIYDWYTSNWGTCSSDDSNSYTTNVGHQRRTVRCDSSNGQQDISKDYCNGVRSTATSGATEPIDQRPCYNGKQVIYNGHFTYPPYEFLVPDGVNAITVEMWGGGGAGGYASSYYTTPPTGNSGGGGGGGGGYSQKTLSVTPGKSYTVDVGLEIASAPQGQRNYSGSSSSFKDGSTTLLEAGGGQGGTHGPGGGQGGIGGTGTTAGAKGSDASGTTGGNGGAAGGSGGGVGGIAGGGVGCSYSWGGCQGDKPGGGGGGGSKGNPAYGGHGANGKVIITW